MLNFAPASTLYGSEHATPPGGLKEPSAHAAVDVWSGIYAAELSYLENSFPTLAPEDLGTMGHLELLRNEFCFL